MVHNIIIGIPVSPRLVTKCPSTHAYSLWQRDFISVHLVITDMQQKCKTNLESLDIQLHTGIYLNVLEKARHLGTKAKYNMITCYFKSIISTKVYQRFWYALVLIIQIRFSTECILKHTDQILINDFWTLFSLIHRLTLSVTDGEMTRHGVE